MKKQLKDYLHFYLGSEVLQDDNEVAKLVGVYAETCMLIHEATEQYEECDISLIKPILRPLSDMTDGERVELFKKCSLFDLSNCEFELGNDWINAVSEGRVIDSILFIGDNINMMNNDGDFYSINPVAPVIEFYFSKHFDLFGLIESGLAIDSTTLNKKT